MSKQIAPPTIMEKICSVYENNVLFPFVVIAMNAAGLGSIDRMLSKRANDHALKQIYTLLNDLSRRVDQQRSEPVSDAFIPGINMAMRSILESESVDKAKRFSAILAPTWNNEARWDEVAQTLKITAALDDCHVHILKAAKAWGQGGPDKDFTFTVEQAAYKNCFAMTSSIPNVDPMLLKACVADLKSLGLAEDSVGVDPVEAYENAKSDNPQPMPEHLPPAYSVTDLGWWVLKRFEEL
ncbi:hypothetical protein V2K16_14375 [Pseudomonas alliivorans]|uniref:hypothetical protein n=1 Tax=Pseudomonas alliivorans TaxID=2810613 RepID=UPI001F311534|nr:hypothetical protein [Pseudomonas alliivorans]MEE4879989.1 hypothetical protein [Pseudomonas alliivorans]MEE4930863.1 hypothetical protein [Pseudomonas alliivorans]MEE4936137.1 hypothetical protein [Pseudomonas alliivorans]MEE4940711.1 hypothetical protein [Pseudomonas alliivorans]MEE4951774.1 hypothetical protein [Pseudomonas alliivorans]